MAAGDTFRAAAAEQLRRGPSAPAPSWCAATRAATRAPSCSTPSSAPPLAGIDLVLADTAGRLHTKTNLMEELRKVRRVAEKGAGRVTEVLLVIDATTGQNGLAQAREFGDASQVTGVVLTKLDGSAKGGIVFAVETELGLPVKLVGVGETIGDLVPFDPAEFVDAVVRSDQRAETALRTPKNGTGRWRAGCWCRRSRRCTVGDVVGRLELLTRASSSAGRSPCSTPSPGASRDVGGELRVGELASDSSHTAVRRRRR